jgi:hypothetical protein
MIDETPKKMSPIKRIIRIAFLIVWSGGIAVLVFWLTASRRPPAEPPKDASEAATMVVVFLFFGSLALVAGVVGYMIILATQCFTSNYDQPIWKDLKARFYAAHIAIPVCVGLGLGMCTAAILTPILTAAGLSVAVALGIPCLGMFLVSQFVLTYVNIWMPIQKAAVKKRMAVFGISEENMHWGIHMGISDPSRSKRKRSAAIEEDIGMMWIRPDMIVYRGDSDGFIIRRGLLAKIERITDSASVTALAGDVSVVITFQNQNGTERTVRLHHQESWTLRQAAKKSNDLADQITTWQNNPPDSQ